MIHGQERPPGLEHPGDFRKGRLGIAQRTAAARRVPELMRPQHPGDHVHRSVIERDLVEIRLHVLDIGQASVGQPLGHRVADKAVKGGRVLHVHNPVLAHPARHQLGVIAAAGLHFEHAHARFQTGELQHQLRLAGRVVLPVRLRAIRMSEQRSEVDAVQLGHEFGRCHFFIRPQARAGLGGVGQIHPAARAGREQQCARHPGKTGNNGRGERHALNFVIHGKSLPDENLPQPIGSHASAKPCCRGGLSSRVFF